MKKQIERQTIDELKILPTSLIHLMLKRLLEALDFKPAYIEEKTKNLSQSMPIRELLLKYGKILHEKNISEELLKNRCIVGDIIINSEDGTTKFNCKYGSSTFVKNINSFVNICFTHAFFPVVDRIIINGCDITEIETYNDFFKQLIMEIDNSVLKSIIINEAQKMGKGLDMLFKVKDALEEVTRFTILTTQFILGENFKKIKNIGALSENLFVEIAIRIENLIRIILGFESSYIQVAGYKDDRQRKTDMYFFYKCAPRDETTANKWQEVGLSAEREEDGKYKNVPIQFTYGNKSKDTDVEKYLVNHKDEHRERYFMIISVKGKFNESIHKNNLLQKYNNWLDNPKEREIVKKKRFPLFIDLVDQKIIQPAEIIYIALHIICRENFEMTFVEGRGYIWDKANEEFLSNKNNIINGINLDKISIEYVKNGEKPGNKNIDLGSIRKRKYRIKYNYGNGVEKYGSKAIEHNPALNYENVGEIILYEW